ncbi:hypothetical protein [Bradyrhizobium erythrophlei]|jgi:hypothetical protein|uniref:hypothetical protein n=1 Tax=Bradyrhizobium erythrophlei TaxID=1437360 RepID=UPI0012AB9D07|nr:hypothetical protein [Bradyrhizobium erythrophlei]
MLFTNLVESMGVKLPPKRSRGERPACCSGHEHRSELRKARRDGLSAIPVVPVKAESDLERIASGAACSGHRPGFKGAPLLA